MSGLRQKLIDAGVTDEAELRLHLNRAYDAIVERPKLRAMAYRPPSKTLKSEN